MTVGEPLHRVDSRDMAVDMDWEYFIPDSGIPLLPPLEPVKKIESQKKNRFIV